MNGMEKINLSLQRSFSDTITATINFVKQEFVPLIRSFVVIGFPMILLMLYLIRNVLMETFTTTIDPYAGYQDSFMDTITNSLITNIVGGLMMWWVQLFSIAYLRVYWDHYRAGVAERITIGEVFLVMTRKFAMFLGWSFVYIVLIVLGTVFFIVPGIYLSVALTFGSYLIVIQDKGFSHIMTEAMELVKGIWWKVFGFMIVLYLLVMVVSYLFSIPLTVLTVTSLLTGEELNIYATTFAVLLAYLGQYTLSIVMYIGMGVLFFTRPEEKEHTTLLSKIDQLGQDTEKMSDEVVD